MEVSAARLDGGVGQAQPLGAKPHLRHASSPEI